MWLNVCSPIDIGVWTCSPVHFIFFKTYSNTTLSFSTIQTCMSYGGHWRIRAQISNSLQQKVIAGMYPKNQFKFKTYCSKRLETEKKWDSHWDLWLNTGNNALQRSSVVFQYNPSLSISPGADTQYNLDLVRHRVPTEK